MMRTITRTVAIAALVMTLVPAALAAEAPATVDLTPNFLAAGANVDRLQVSELAGIVIIRGRTFDRAEAEAVGRLAQSMGYTRVANLIQISERVKDDEIARKAEVELTVNRALDGCRFRVTSQQGVVTVAGSVQHELQKDVAMQVLRNIDGVRDVQLALNRF